MSEQIPERHPAAVVERVGERTMVATSDDVLHVFVDEQETPSEVGERILALADGRRTVRDIARVICREFEVGEDTALRDTELFVQELVRQNVLVLKS